VRNFSYRTTTGEQNLDKKTQSGNDGLDPKVKNLEKRIQNLEKMVNLAQQTIEHDQHANGLLPKKEVKHLPNEMT
jgi:hypothetical protein